MSRVGGHMPLAWNEVVDAAPDLAERVQQRFEAHPHHVIATLRADGRPRVSGTNVMFGGDRLWIGTMPGSRKGADLAADERCALHSAPLDEDLAAGNGDATIDAIATRLDDQTGERLLSEQFGENATMEGALWSLSVRSLSLVEVDGEQLHIRSWNSQQGVTEVLRD